MSNKKRKKTHKNYYNRKKKSTFSEYSDKAKEYFETNKVVVTSVMAFSVLALSVVFGMGSLMSSNDQQVVNDNQILGSQVVQEDQIIQIPQDEAVVDEAVATTAVVNQEISSEAQAEKAMIVANAEVAVKENASGVDTSLLHTSTVNPLAIKVTCLEVNNSPIAYFKSEEDAQRTLDALNSKFITTEDGKETKEYFYSEQVEIKDNYISLVDFSGFKEDEVILDYIVRGTDERRTHKVKSGENFWVIAIDYGITVDDLMKANPDTKPEAIQIGQEISLIVPVPLINICTVEEVTYSENIAFDVEYEDSSDYYKGEYQTKKSGIYGKQEVVAEIIRENGIEKARKVLTTEVISEPTTKVVYAGTKPLPAKIGTGTFQNPASRGYYISSEFGMRWGRPHTGIDIALSMGSNVRASDGGMVIYSGYRGSYGYAVEIDHGGGYTTLYAHNSQLLVNVGDRVYKDQLIAYSGNSGFSTGPHCHFEVRYLGTPQNPRNYVNF